MAPRLLRTARHETHTDRTQAPVAAWDQRQPPQSHPAYQVISASPCPRAAATSLPDEGDQIAVDLGSRVIHQCLTMKTAKVRDLRTPGKAHRPTKIDWAARLAKRSPLGKGLSEDARQNLWSDLRD